ncbi:MAG: hypothetical protein VZQ83_07365 [Eubacterium sp.]|nr:hypothetical protein [Eubacterium sp.]
MRKRIGFVWMGVLALGIASLIGTGTGASAKSSGRYVSDLQFSFTPKSVVLGAWNNRVPDLDSWDLIGPDMEDGGDIDMEGDKAFAYAKAYVKRTDDASESLRDIQVRTDFDDRTEKKLKDSNKKMVAYQCVLPQNPTNKYFNMLYTTRNETSGDPICDVYFLKDSLDCNGAEFAFNRYVKANPIPETSYAARAYEMNKEKIPVYTVVLRDNIAKKYVSDVVLVKGTDDKTRAGILYKGYNFVKIVELGNTSYMLGIKRTDNVAESLRGVYLVKDGESDYKLYKSKSKGAGMAIVDVCPESEMLVKEGEIVSVGDWVKKYFLGDGFRKFVKSFIEKSDTAFKKNKNSSLHCTGGEVKLYDDLSVLKADMGFEDSVLAGVDVAAGSRTAESIAVVRRYGETSTGDIVIGGIDGTGTSDPEKLESYRQQLGSGDGSGDETVTESEPPAQVETEGDAVSPASASATGSFISSGTFLWVLIPVVVIMLGAVVFVYVRRKK